MHKIDGATIRPNSLPGNRIQTNTVTGKQVKESTLGHVPYATAAGTAAKLPPLVWHPLTLINNWQAIGQDRTPAYAIDAQGIVHLQGAISGGTSTTAAFVLPPTARPATGEAYLPLIAGGGNYVGLLDVVASNGDGLIQNGGGAPSTTVTAFTSLEGVTYPTD